METGKLKTFAAKTRVDLMRQVARRLSNVLPDDSDARREYPDAMQALEREIARTSKDAVIEKVAYTWFNRFTALRFMDVCGYLTPQVVSPAEGETRPEILSLAAAGTLPDHLSQDMYQHIQGLLTGRVLSSEPQVDAYRALVVASCNHLNGVMPFLFEKIADYTELLMPNELLSDTGWVANLREVMTAESCQDVEIIGWLYQFYISEKKDQVFADLKKNKKITAENIPAATQLFTPHWIVRYLVENSLGRLWLLNNPGSDLASKMEYYIAPEEPETDFLKIGSPEEIKICDPACGSGHMLTYAFDLLYEIYLERGYADRDIPELILTHNLTGIEIDERAGGLAGFALMMKAAAKLGRRRFMRMQARPNIVVLEDVEFSDSEMQDVAAVVGKNMFTDDVRDVLSQFDQATNFGSLIVPKLRDPAETLRVVEARDFGGDLLLSKVQERVVTVLRMAEALAPKYHVVVANPPYAGAKGLNGSLGDFIKSEFPKNKADLFAAFIERSRLFGVRGCALGFMTPFTWMFLSSYEHLRSQILHECALISLVKPEYHSFFESAYVPVCAFVFANQEAKGNKSAFFDLSEFYGAENQAPNFRKAISDPQAAYRYAVAPHEFDSIPGSPLAFWLPSGLRAAFQGGEPISELSPTKQGIKTGNNEKFLRLWPEVAQDQISLGCENTRWCPVSKGGAFRKWYGNNEYVLDWEDNGHRVRNYTDESGKQLSRPQNTQFFFKGGLTWSTITVSSLSMRLLPDGFAFESTGSICSTENVSLRIELLSFLNSSVVDKAISAIAPTMNYGEGAIGKLPYLKPKSLTENSPKRLVSIAKSDWDAYEISWDFTTLPLLSPDHRSETLEATYTTLRAHWQSMTDEMQRLEEENNRIFIEAYGLQDELTPEVPIEEITLTCNPHYSIKGNHDDETREAKLLTRTMEEFVSYAVGCMFGRYSLDVPGLVLANQGETLDPYIEKVAQPSFMPDDDNVIPVLDGDWFEDDISVRMKEFLKVTFGDQHYSENLDYLQAALGRELTPYFTKQFYKDHTDRYKRRPIYWMVSSPNGTFQALIYMHRYNPDTLSRVLNQYVRPFRDKLEAARHGAEKLQDDTSASTTERNRAARNIDKLAKAIREITDWERDHLYPMAQQRIPIDLDDGVKKNYPRFAGVMKPVKGLSDA